MPRNYAFSEELKQYSVGAAKSNISPVADFIAPTVQVGSPTGRYKEYTDTNRFRIPDTERASGGRAVEIGFSKSDKTYDCKPNAIDVPVDHDEADEEGLNLAFQEAADLAAEVGGLSHEKKVVDMAIASASPITPSFAAAVDPVKVLDEYITALIKGAAYGSIMDIRICLGADFLRMIKQHPMLAKKILAGNSKANGLALVTEELLSAMLIGNPKVRTSYMVVDTAAEGRTANRNFILGASMLLFVARDNPTRRDPSFMKTFRLRNKVMVPGSYERDDGRVTVAKFDWSEHVALTNSAGAYLITPTW
ncbi:MAG: hypothetical protein PHI93_11760 [Kiritimatiellae bacterium]|nr:hypothetical protein [Kiritimatiellia bacterium]